ncbi:hypothetical protein [Nocardia callitridis]|uniref:Uncharacterized protein n=1 Tax=Nocardia callitridis TaxID=648753 RepID=A0ABP9KGT6_9NOCA
MIPVVPEAEHRGHDECDRRYTDIPPGAPTFVRRTDALPAAPWWRRLVVVTTSDPNRGAMRQLTE